MHLGQEIEKLNGLSAKKNQEMPKNTSFATMDTPLPSDEERSQYYKPGLQMLDPSSESHHPLTVELIKKPPIYLGVKNSLI